MPVNILETQTKQMGFATSPLTGTTPSVNNIGNALATLVTGSLQVYDKAKKGQLLKQQAFEMQSDILMRETLVASKKGFLNEVKDINNTNATELRAGANQMLDKISKVTDMLTEKDRLSLESAQLDYEKLAVAAEKQDFVNKATNMVISQVDSYNSESEFRGAMEKHGGNYGAGLSSLGAQYDEMYKRGEFAGKTVAEINMMAPGLQYIHDPKIAGDLKKFIGKRKKVELAIEQVSQGLSIESIMTNTQLTKTEVEAAQQEQFLKNFKTGDVAGTFETAGRTNSRIDVVDRQAKGIFELTDQMQDGQKDPVTGQPSQISQGYIVYDIYKKMRTRYDYNKEAVANMREIEAAGIFLGLGSIDNQQEFMQAAELAKQHRNDQLPEIADSEYRKKIGIELTPNWTGIGITYEDIPDKGKARFVYDNAKKLYKYTNNINDAIILAGEQYDKLNTSDYNAPTNMISYEKEDIDSLLKHNSPDFSISGMQIEYDGDNRWRITDTVTESTRTITTDQAIKEIQDNRAFDDAIKIIDSMASGSKLKDKHLSKDSLEVNKYVDDRINEASKATGRNLTTLEKEIIRKTVRKRIVDGMHNERRTVRAIGSESLFQSGTIPIDVSVDNNSFHLGKFIDDMVAKVQDLKIFEDHDVISNDGSFNPGKRTDGWKGKDLEIKKDIINQDDVNSNKSANGWLGKIETKDGGIMTENSITIRIDAGPEQGKYLLIPSVVPGLTPDEINYLRDGGSPFDNPAIMEKAINHASQQISKGESPFYQDPTPVNPVVAQAGSTNLQQVQSDAQGQAGVTMTQAKPFAGSRIPSREDVKTATQSLNEFDKEKIKLEGKSKSKDGLYRPFQSIEGGEDTIAHGHKLTPEEVKSGKIYGIDYRKGLTEEQANQIYFMDKEQSVKDLGLENFSEEIKFLATDVAYRAGDIKDWKFLKYLKEGKLNDAYAELGDMFWIDKSGKKQFYNNRNKAIFKKVGHVISGEAQVAYNMKQQAAKMKSKKRNTK